jgi:CheY-like chemotaxis protein
LEDLGYTVRRVASADAALAILAEDEFSADLVFSDVIMPGMTASSSPVSSASAIPACPWS